MLDFILKIVTFGMSEKIKRLNERLVIAEDVINTIDDTIDEKVSNIDMDEAIRNTFSPSDYDIISEGDYPLEEIDYKITEEECREIVEDMINTKVKGECRDKDF